jgi:GDP/UDP-N,N'-diacetylbacillosamine 2-epimerase (hydrolysing)
MIKKTKTICAITGSRAEFGLFLPVLELIRKDPLFKLSLVATGAHLSAKHNSVDEIGKYFPRFQKIPLGNFTNSSFGTLQATASCMTKIGRYLSKNKPDVIVLIGDRFETFGAACAAFFLNIPIAHIHGGEITYGAIDDVLRHSITKMAYWHFVSASEYKQRVVQLGEDPERVFLCGAIGLDNIRKNKTLSKKDLAKKFKFNPKEELILVTLHPETTKSNSYNEEMTRNLLDVLEKKVSSFLIFLSEPNEDPGSDHIRAAFYKFQKKHPNRVFLKKNYGVKVYHSLLKHCRVILGNSSSGVIEAPFVGVPSVNIGERQLGRVFVKSVYNCLHFEKDINKTLNFAIKKKKQKPSFELGDGYAATKIVSTLSNLLKKKYRVKKFYDLK